MSVGSFWPGSGRHPVPTTSSRVGRFVAAFVLVLIAAITTPVDAQNFRGEVVATQIISGPAETRTELGAGQVLLLGFTEEYPFPDGVEINIVPEAGRTLPAGSFSLAVFEGVDRSVQDQEGFTTIAGRPLGTIPLRGSTSVLIPLVRESRASDRSTASRHPETLPPADRGRGYIAAQIVPSMKGMNPAIENTVFSLRVVPRLSGEGGIRISLHGEPEIVEQALDQLALTLNNVAIEPGSINTVSPGIYRLTAIAGDYLEHTENIGVEAGRTVNRTLPVREPRALIRVRVPSVAEVFLDGVRLSGDARSTVERAPGHYMVLIRVGDFSISRRIHLKANQEYEIGLDLDILFKQD